MKTQIAVLAAIAVMMVFVFQSHAIEGLNLSIQSSNVVVAWPSDPSSGDTFIVQRRDSLDTNSAWVTLTNFYLAAEGTNITSFVDSNAVCVPVDGGSGGEGGDGPPSPESLSSFQTSEETSFPPLPPLPWETETSSSISRNLAQNLSSGEETGTGVCAGFYRVVRNGVDLFGLTNGTILHGTVELPIELAATNENLLSINLYADGAPCVGATAQTNDSGSWILQWDTTAVRNGDYSIHLEADFGDATVVGFTNTVTVSNLISFPYFSLNQFYNDNLWIEAELSVPEASYIIDIYDDQNNYLGYFPGSTTNGLISFIWDFSAVNPPFTNDGFRAEYFITLSGTASRDKPPDAKKFHFREQNWNPTGFVVAFGAVDGNSTTTSKIEEMIRDGVVNTLDGTYTLSPGNRAYTTAFELLPGTLDSFTNALKDMHNLYWFGHGSATTITPINHDARLTFLQIQNLLKNFQNGTNYIDRHPYQLVFIDGCENGKGDFCTAFGIPALTVDRAFFSASGLRSRAYLGFKEEVNFNTGQTLYRASMLQGFFADWLRNQPLYICVSNATHLATQPMPDSWVIYGATNLQRNLP